MKRLLLPMLLVTTATVLSHAQSAIDRRVDSLLSLMTLDEKVGQLVQCNHDAIDRSGWIRQGRVGSMLNLIGVDSTRKYQQIAVEQSRLKIPLIFGFDVIHGFRTTFPIPLAWSCTWNPDLIEQAEHVAATEATASGVNWAFAPMVDIARDARWGRIAEGAGQDPYLGSAIAAACVRGFQGTDLAAPTSLLACAKHFAAYGGAEGGRDYNTVDISERTLREVYLPPFHAAVEAGAGTLMCSFNEIGGVPSSVNRELLTDILRGEWQFKGFVVSDWNSIGELINHGVAADHKQAAVKAIHAGVDMDMESYSYSDNLASAAKEGLVPESELDEAVRRVLRLKFETGLMDNPYKDCDAQREKTQVLTPADRALARTVADQSIVLLKNVNNILPLKKNLKSIAVIGPLADDKADMLGPWSGAGRPADVVTVVSGIKKKVGMGTQVVTARGCGITDPSKAGFFEALAMAKDADAVVVVAGESRDMSGEASSRSDIGLPGVQEELLRDLQATGKPIVVVLMNGRPLAVPWIAQNCAGVVEAWFLGVEAGNAVADVLFGDENPSGKLTTSFPRATGQVPIYYNHKNTGRPANDTLKFTSRYIDLPSTPLYPFGYGLSYTSYAYSDLRLSSKKLSANDSIIASVVVKNTGDRAGVEIAQLYIHDEVASVTRPVKELKGFQRVSLKPGESRRVEFVLRPDQLKFYNLSMQYTVEPGTFDVFVGPSSAEGLEGKFDYVEK